MKKVYIAGKVTGEPIAECTMKFGTAQKEIEKLGFEAINPLEVVGDWKAPWNVAMKKCVSALVQCDAMMLLSDWSDSKGAIMEFEMAENLNIPVFRFSKNGLSQLNERLCN